MINTYGTAVTTYASTYEPHTQPIDKWVAKSQVFKYKSSKCTGLGSKPKRDQRAADVGRRAANALPTHKQGVADV